MNTRNISYTITIGLLVIFYVCFTGCGSDRPERDAGLSFMVVRVNEPPDIDGVLNDSCWSSLESSTLVNSVDGAEPSLPTTVRVGYDDTYLYVGFECQDPDAVSTVTAHDGPVFSGEHVALYIDANSDRNTYAIIEVAPSGIIRDAFVLSYNDGEKRMFLADWRCEGIRPSVTIYGGNADEGTEDRFWTVELAIPLEAFFTAPSLPPKPGDEWLANIYRAELTNRREYSALVPTGDEGFHRPRSFVRFIFGEVGVD